MADLYWPFPIKVSRVDIIKCITRFSSDLVVGASGDTEIVESEVIDLTVEGKGEANKRLTENKTFLLSK